ncbi:LysM peptidoglycan-binding domain-containing protein [Vibrio parahaemolyticus]|nr:LysM peptidoglycan-binding domain-containing protein [Vibrio parahaemolyticus]MBE4089841.1 LysM peptidoglycan-binding domain-containing protein [Vibrio parahaemolyticus]
MLKKIIITITYFYSITIFATEYYEIIHITPKLDFVSQLNSEDSSDFGLGYTLDICLPISDFVSIDNTVRYIDWNSEQFEDNFLQYGILLRFNFPFTEKTNFALSGGFLADLDVGNESRNKEVNPYLKFDVDYNINRNWAIVLGFNQSFSVDYLDQYAYSLGVKYKFYKNRSSTELQSVCDCDFEEIEESAIKVEKLVEPTTEDELEHKVLLKEEDSFIIDYVLENGDYIYLICRRFNMSLSEFLNMNKAYFSGRNLDYVYPGEVVKVRVKNK